jgi:uncharacterized heparinase superfamily protein
LSTWDKENWSLLWRYNLHYFDDLNARDAASRYTCHVELLQSWIRASLPTYHVAWSPYPTSLRISNWIKWLSRYPVNAVPETLQSLAQQAHILEQRIEYHLLGNHLFENARALTLAGVYFAGLGADKWLTTGLRILDRELPEQFLDDGGHFELSPMYQATVLWGLLDLIELASGHEHPALRERRHKWTQYFSKGVYWLETMSFPDGAVSFFNDAAFGIGPKVESLRLRAKQLSIDLSPVCEPSSLVGVHLTWLRSSGYARVDWSDAVLIADVARIGPDYLPAHAHADTLSFEFSLGAARVFVNSGTSIYDKSTERNRQRGTAAHNTVVVDNENSSDVWEGFRVAKRAYPQIGQINAHDGVATLVCSHTGYLRLPGKVRHQRKWVCKGSQLDIEDSLDGRFTIAYGHLLLHPEWKIAEYSERTMSVLHTDGRRINIEVEGGIIRAEAGTWHPRFGVSVPTTRLVTDFIGNRALHRISW